MCLTKLIANAVFLLKPSIFSLPCQDFIIQVTSRIVETS